NSASILQYLANNIPNIARYIYMDVTNTEVEHEMLSNEYLTLLSSITPYSPDRYMLKDKSTSLDTVSAKKIIKNACKMTGLTEDYFGICNSPLSFGEMACLTAVKARELMSLYSNTTDMPLPTANHQSMNTCGCIRYLVVNCDTEAPLDTKSKSSSTKTANTEKKVTNTENKPKAKNSTPFINFI
ncbi:MAG: hypothetical protein J6A59_17030, partial [Lachnospiraceae bacterium]|nr:hypothetical protein [Lachnospiraceae bacterium]